MVHDVAGKVTLQVNVHGDDVNVNGHIKHTVEIVGLPWILAALLVFALLLRKAPK